MPLTEINFDGIVGPSHNYAGLSLGNLAAMNNAGRVSYPRAAALQGIAKMRANLDLGLRQGIFLPHPRPARGWLAELGTTIEQADPALTANAMSASPMWAANAATVSPAPDTGDGRCHLTTANLRTMAHRSHEWPETLRQLRLAFRDSPAFAVHPPIPSAFGDEGAANHMRLCASHDQPGLEIFVHGTSGGPYPARQNVEAGRAIARLHQLDPARVLFVEQSPEAIAAGAFHNDVVAVANGPLLFAHEQAFAEREQLFEQCARLIPGFQLVEVPASDVPLGEAIRSYLFNAQLVTPTDGVTTLVAPAEVRAVPSVWSWLQRHLAENGLIQRLEIVDVRESMSNGGGPACLRLRVVCDPETVDPRFLVDEPSLDLIEDIIARHWPETIDPSELTVPSLHRQVEHARELLIDKLELRELLSG